MPEPAEFTGTLVRFSRALRRAGLAVGPGDALVYCEAVAMLTPSDLVDVYWAGRSTLVTRLDQIPTYDRVFNEYFLGEDAEPTEGMPYSITARAEAQAVLQVPESEAGQESGDEQEARLGLMASDSATLKSKSFSACTPDELVALHKIMKTIRLTPRAGAPGVRLPPAPGALRTCAAR